MIVEGTSNPLSQGLVCSAGSARGSRAPQRLHSLSIQYSKHVLVLKGR